MGKKECNSRRSESSKCEHRKHECPAKTIATFYNVGNVNIVDNGSFVFATHGPSSGCGIQQINASTFLLVKEGLYTVNVQAYTTPPPPSGNIDYVYEIQEASGHVCGCCYDHVGANNLSFNAIPYTLISTAGRQIIGISLIRVRANTYIRIVNRSGTPINLVEAPPGINASLIIELEQ